MPKRQLIVPLLILLAALAGLNLLVAYRARTLPRLILQRIDRAPRADFLALGNSLVAADFRAETFQAALPPGMESQVMLNVGCGGTLPAETLQFYQAASRKLPPIRCVIQGLMFTQLTTSSQAEWKELAGNRAMFYYTDFELGLSLYEPQTWFSTLQFRLTRWFPLVYERLNIWRHVELLRRKFDRLGLRAAETTSFGRVSDFEADPFQPANPGILAEECRRVLNGGAGLSRPVLETIRQARQSGSTVIFVQMPLPLARRDYFHADGIWADYRRHLRDLLQAEGAVYIDALDWLSDDSNSFMDNAHLKRAGAEEFSRRIAPVIAAKTLETEKAR